jgi:nitrate/TMAO reductase-like tetraheme cytochrome c subunit
MRRRVWGLWRGLSTNAIGAADVVLTTSSFVAFVVFEALRLAGVLTNTYVGLITYLTLPALFVFGLLLIPVGWWIFKRRSGKSGDDLLLERFDPETVEARPTGRPVFVTIAVFTLLNLIFLGAGGARMLHFMDQPEFCGTACHSVMHPEWEAYQASPHARVRCVDCHVGQGAEAALDAKLNGMWQMVSVTFDLYEKPIPTPVHNLRPARETCEQCHWPEAFYGDRIKRIESFEMDRGSTPRFTTLSLKVGSGMGERRGEIHWHVAEENEVRYLAADPERERMAWVEVRQPGGGWKRFTNRSVEPGSASAEAEVRSMDCVDCHNRATHIFPSPETAVDELMASGAIDPALPYAKRQAFEALTGGYVGSDDALAGIDRDFRGFYAREHPEAYTSHADAIDRAVAALQSVYKRAIHPRMNVSWDSYPNHIGHDDDGGCRRCHNPDLVDESGRAVANGCTLCHSILAYDSPRPFEYLDEPDPGSRDFRAHEYLRREFLGLPAPEERHSYPAP